ncbi:MAG: VOC family protein [Promethearchaeota archaeon]
MESNLRIDLSNLKIDQLGYVYKDIEKQAKIMENLFKIPKFTFMPNFSGTIKYRGKNSDITSKIAFSRNFNIQIELIQLIEGECIYKEFLDKGRQGLHHLAIFVEGMQSYIDLLDKLNYPIIQSGQIGRQAYAYFDTEESLGILLEIEETLKRQRKK